MRLRARVPASTFILRVPETACALTVERQERRSTMHVLYQRCAAVDIGKDVIAVAVRLPGDGPEHRQTIKRTFKTFYGVLKHAAGRRVTGVSLRIGHLRQVVPDSLAFYFELVSRETLCEGARLEQEVVPALV